MRRFKWGELDPETGEKHFPLHRAQQDVLRSSARFVFACAGTGGGKSVLIPLKLLQRIEENPSGRFLIVMPDYGMLARTGLLEQIQSLLEGTQYEGIYGKLTHIYSLGTGGHVFFCSAEKPDSIEGGQYDAVFIDEAAKVNYEAWRNAKARAGQKNAPVFLVSTPDTNTWIYNEIYLRWKSGDKDYYVRQWSSADNPSYPKEVVENARQTMSSSEFLRRYHGEFARAEGLVYDTFSEQIIENDRKLPSTLPSPAIRIACGIDWGWRDPFCCLVGVECQDGRIYLVEELYGSEIPIDQLARHLKAIRKRWAVEVDDYDTVEGGRFVGFYCDSSRPEIINQFRRYGINARPKRIPQIETGIAMVDTRLRTDYLKIYDCCVNLVEESHHYQRKAVGDGQFGEKAIDRHNHAMDALRYLITGLDAGRTLDFGGQRAAADEAETSVNEETAEAKLKRLGLEGIKESTEETENERSRDMAFGTDGNDDPYGIWSKF